MSTVTNCSWCPDFKNPDPVYHPSGQLDHVVWAMRRQYVCLRLNVGLKDVGTMWRFERYKAHPGEHFDEAMREVPGCMNAVISLSDKHVEFYVADDSKETCRKIMERFVKHLELTRSRDD